MSRVDDHSTDAAAYRLAHDGVSQIVLWATTYITSVRQAVERASQPEIMILRARRDFLLDSRRDLIEEVAAHSRAHHHHSGQSGAWSLSIAIALIGGAFLFAVKTIEPFGLGWMGWAYCAALAIALPYALDRFLQEFRHRAVVRVLVCATFVTSLATALLFGVLRGDVLAKILDAEPAVVIDNVDATEPAAESNKTSEMLANLRQVWGLAALAFELAAGIALHDFRRRRRFDFGAFRRLHKELLKVERDLLHVMQRLQQLLSEPTAIEVAFWTNFERGVQDARNRNSRWGRIASAVLGGILSAYSIQGSDNLHIVSAVDLSKTAAVVTYTGKSEFRENVGAVSTILANIPVGSRMTIIGITDRSYTKPLILLDARTAPDPGAFSNRLISARRALILEWKKRSQSLEPSFVETDLVGVLMYAGEVLSRSDAQRKVIVILSDGRHYSAELDLETPKAIDVAKSLQQIEKQELFATLHGVEVFLLGGGDRSGKRGTEYAYQLRDFWKGFVERSGGTLKIFSTGREEDVLAEISHSVNREEGR